MRVSKFLSIALFCFFFAFSGVSYGKTHHKRTTTKSKTTARRSSLKSKSKSRKVSASSRSKKKSLKSRTSRSRRSRRTVARRSTQQAPTPDRYREIQQALADKGYFRGEVNGSWGPDSVAALKQFQKDQSLADTGKLNSVSLIALGLGPKRNLNALSTPESRTNDDHRSSEGSERP